MVPVPDQWCPMENRCQVTEVALVDLCLAVGLGSGRVDRGEEADLLSALLGFPAC